MSDSPNSIRAFAVPSDTTEQLVADPIYAAIEAHRRADEEYGRAELWKDNNPAGRRWQALKERTGPPFTMANNYFSHSVKYFTAARRILTSRYMCRRPVP
jgi:hypothetical protein